MRKLFWLFRRRKALKPAHFYLDSAASIMQARGKSEATMIDRRGRVDVFGALRIAVYGSTEYEVIDKINKRYASVERGNPYWSKYCECKLSLLAYIKEQPVTRGGKIKPWMFADSDSDVIAKWSDNQTAEEVIDGLRLAAITSRKPLHR